jgi:aminopeptidase-like protein
VTDEDRHAVEMYEFLARLFPICRSITGDGVRETLSHISDLGLPLVIREIPSGTQVFDWSVPQEWNIREAYIEHESGVRIVDFADSNLHVVGYSVPVDCVLSLEDLQCHLHSIEGQPEAIPYVTYYERNWGFCLTHAQRESLPEGKYRVHIDSTLEDGSLTYGELIVKGQTQDEVLISTYVCHPSMANNELSGPVIACYLAKWLLEASPKMTYRFVFLPETIGAIAFLSRNLEWLKCHMIAGFNLTCLGDEGSYSYVASRYGVTLADRVAEYVGNTTSPSFSSFSFLERGSDERQYCAPGVDLPLVTLCRSKFGTYPEYHTSLDDLSFVTPAGLAGGYRYVKACIEAVDNNVVPVASCLGEPQLGKRGLYPALSKKGSASASTGMLNVLAYADGGNDLLDIAGLTGLELRDVCLLVEQLVGLGLLTTSSGRTRNSSRLGRDGK